MRPASFTATILTTTLCPAVSIAPAAACSAQNPQDDVVSTQMPVNTAGLQRGADRATTGALGQLPGCHDFQGSSHEVPEFHWSNFTP